MWCPDPKSSKFVISRDVIIDKNFMLQPRKESVVNSTGSVENKSKWVELESKDSDRVQASTHVEAVDDAQGDDTPQE